MNRWFLAAGLGMAGIVVLHLWGGGRDVHVPLRVLAGPGEMGLYVSVLWHGVSLLLIASAAALLAAARDPSGGAGLAIVAAAQAGGLAALFLAYGVIDLGTVWTAPQWLLLAPVAGLAVVGLARRGRA